MANENEELADEAFDGDEDDGDELLKFCWIELTRQPLDSGKLFGDDQIEPEAACSCDETLCEVNIMSEASLLDLKLFTFNSSIISRAKNS